MSAERPAATCQKCDGTGLVSAFGEAGEFGGTECCPSCEDYSLETNRVNGSVYARGNGKAKANDEERS